MLSLSHTIIHKHFIHALKHFFFFYNFAIMHFFVYLLFPPVLSRKMRTSFFFCAYISVLKSFSLKSYARNFCVSCKFFLENFCQFYKVGVFWSCVLSFKIYGVYRFSVKQILKLFLLKFVIGMLKSIFKNFHCKNYQNLNYLNMEIPNLIKIHLDSI